MNEPETIRAMLGTLPRTIAVIGLSANPAKPSHYVPAYMQQQGYRILPVNPTVDSVLGEQFTRLKSQVETGSPEPKKEH